MHSVDQFNAGVFGILITTDEIRGKPIDTNSFDESLEVTGKSARMTSDYHDQFGESRGLDFQNVEAGYTVLPYFYATD